MKKTLLLLTVILGANIATAQLKVKAGTKHFINNRIIKSNIKRRRNNIHFSEL